ncbi:hypothetical protein [Nitrosopumilus piranensis]|uniref:Uncharacterized protein n=1 Tax=Nitrosopumilus piranensis TaxID=1582439 RepID=A0A0C5CD08_9ARCH|nr:hypothetical protein [Nitrosopumilus piranensis]AJM93062.1 hypothetical protein NPIRD3C_1852 [Nitrosopumilus piranensis]
MHSSITKNIHALEKDVLEIEGNIKEFSKSHNVKEIRKSHTKLRSDLKDLGMFATNSCLKKDENRQIVDFLKIHYSYLQQFSIDKSFQSNILKREINPNNTSNTRRKNHGMSLGLLEENTESLED